MPCLVFHPWSLTSTDASPDLRLLSERLSHWSEETSHGDLAFQWSQQIIELKLTDILQMTPAFSHC